MIEAKKGWTPGPWKAHFLTGDRGQVKGKKIFSSIFVPLPGQRFGSKATVLSPAWNEFDGGLWDAWLRCKPEDAHLICAAPDLYDALEDLIGLASAAMSQANGDGAEYDVDGELSDARAALRKARGEEPTP